MPFLKFSMSAAGMINRSCSFRNWWIAFCRLLLQAYEFEMYVKKSMSVKFYPTMDQGVTPGDIEGSTPNKILRYFDRPNKGEERGEGFDRIPCGSTFRDYHSIIPFFIYFQQLFLFENLCVMRKDFH